MTKGHCKHGEFILTEGCPQCLAERRSAGIRPEQAEMEDGLNAEGLTLAGAQEAKPVTETKNFEEVRHKCKSCGAEWTVRMLLVGDIALPTYVGSDAYLCPECKSGNTIMFSNREKVEQPTAETATALRPGEDIEAHGYFKEAMKLLEYAESRHIATVEDFKLANDDLSIISKLKKAMEEKRKEYLEPLKAQTEAIRGTYDYLMMPVLQADRLTRVQILDFSKEQERIRAEQEEINRKRMEAAEAEMRLKGELTESVNLVEVSPEAPKRVSTDMGTTGLRDNWKYEVTDFALLPDEYKVVDTAMLNSIAKKHHDQKQISGVRFFNEPIIAVTARKGE